MTDFLVLTTAKGVIKARLCPDDAPETVKAIKTLVNGGYYENCCFYRAEPGFVVQGGLKRLDGTKVTTPITSIPLEVKRLNERGALTMARWEDPSSGSGTFFIVLGDSPHLDRTGDEGWSLGFAVFGQVVSGMEIADAMTEEETTLSGGLSMLDSPIGFTAHIETVVE